jgi:hypothetical protein
VAAFQPDFADFFIAHRLSLLSVLTAASNEAAAIVMAPLERVSVAAPVISEVRPTVPAARPSS